MLWNSFRIIGFLFLEGLVEFPLTLSGFALFFVKIDTFISVKKSAFGILIGIALNLWIALGSMDILTLLSLLIHEMVCLFIYLFLFKFLSAMFCVTLIDFHTFNYPCIPGINPTWS